jgi:acyl dehydratase
VSFDLSQIGRSRESEEFRVNTARLAQFAAAINDANPAHAEGRIAAPVFANVPPMQVTIEALQGVTRAFAYHGQHDFHLHRPIVPGMRLISRATLHGVQPSAAGVSVIVRTDTRTADDEVVNEQYFTALVAGARLAEGVGRAGPDHRFPEGAAAQTPMAKARYPMDADQTRRYADASRDYSDYALDLEAARAKGLDGVLVHGMLTMAFAGRAIVEKACGGDSTRLKRLAGRFSRPVYLVPNQAVTTTIWSLGRRDGRAVYGFEAREAGGAVVIRHGMAEVA